MSVTGFYNCFTMFATFFFLLSAEDFAAAI